MPYEITTLQIQTFGFMYFLIDLKAEVLVKKFLYKNMFFFVA